MKPTVGSQYELHLLSPAQLPADQIHRTAAAATAASPPLAVPAAAMTRRNANARDNQFTANIST